eukprot:g3933.t1
MVSHFLEQPYSIPSGQLSAAAVAIIQSKKGNTMRETKLNETKDGRFKTLPPLSFDTSSLSTGNSRQTRSHSHSDSPSSESSRSKSRSTDSPSSNSYFPGRYLKNTTSKRVNRTISPPPPTLLGISYDDETLSASERKKSISKRERRKDSPKSRTSIAKAHLFSFQNSSLSRSRTRSPSPALKMFGSILSINDSNEAIRESQRPTETSSSESLCDFSLFQTRTKSHERKNVISPIEETRKFFDKNISLFEENQKQFFHCETESDSGSSTSEGMGRSFKINQIAEKRKKRNRRMIQLRRSFRDKHVTASRRRSENFVSAAVASSAAKVAAKAAASAIAAARSAGAEASRKKASPRHQRKHNRPWIKRSAKVRNVQHTYDMELDVAPDMITKQRAQKTVSKTRHLFCLASRYSSVMRRCAEKMDGIEFKRQRTLSAEPKDGDIVVVKGESQLREVLCNPGKGIFLRMIGAKQVCTKINLTKALQHIKCLLPAEEDIFWPKTWILPDALVSSMNETLQSSMEDSAGNYFLVKPSDGCQGDGIFLVNTFSELCMNLRCIESGRQSKQRWVIQQYIPRPHLLNGFKWDLRVYVACTSLQPLRVHVCREGLARLCTVKYKEANRKNMTQVRSHLTNYSLNKKSLNFQLSDQPTGGLSSKRAITAVLKMLEEQYSVDTNKVWEEICKVSHRTIQALAPQLVFNANRIAPSAIHGQTVHIFGLDLLLDRDLKVWLLEINANPSLSIDSVVPWKDTDDIKKVKCKCGDMEAPHYHEISPIDKNVKMAITCGLFQLLGYKVDEEQNDYPYDQSYTTVSNEHDSFSRASDAVMQISKIFEMVNGEQGFDGRKMRSIVAKCNINNSNFSFHDADTIFRQRLQLACQRDKDKYENTDFTLNDFIHVFLDICAAINNNGEEELIDCVNQLLANFWRNK